MKFRLFPSAVGLVTALLGCSVNLYAAPREWTDQATGRKITAEFVSLEGDQVTLSINGKEYKLPVSKLSPDDQAYLKIVGDTPAPAPTPTASPEAAPAAPAAAGSSPVRWNRGTACRMPNIPSTRTAV